MHDTLSPVRFSHVTHAGIKQKDDTANFVKKRSLTEAMSRAEECEPKEENECEPKEENVYWRGHLMVRVDKWQHIAEGTHTGGGFRVLICTAFINIEANVMDG